MKYLMGLITLSLSTTISQVTDKNFKDKVFARSVVVIKFTSKWQEKTYTK